MEAEFWYERWARNQIGFHQPGGNPALREHLPALHLAPGKRVFVPLCGKSTDMAWLAERGHEVVGVELSEHAVRAFFAEQALPAEEAAQGGFTCTSGGGVTLLCGDFFALSPSVLGAVDAVYDRAALIALPPAMRPAYARHLLTLAGGAPVLLLTLCYPQEQMDGPPFSVAPAEVAALFGEHRTQTLLDTRDILEQQPHFRERGLRRLQEQVWLLV